MAELYKRKPNIQCSICEKWVYRRPFNLQQSNGKAFCGMKCYGLSSRKEVPCVVCGKLILSGKNKISCSRTCANKHRAGIQYKIGRPRDKFVQAQAMKIRLLEIRGGKCERCKFSKKEILEVHHKNRNRNDNSDKNLEIICPNCHAEEHYLNCKK